MGLCTDRPGSLDTTENGDAGGHEPWQILFDPLANRLAGVECMGGWNQKPMLGAADDIVDRMAMDCGHKRAITSMTSAKRSNKSSGRSNNAQERPSQSVRCRTESSSTSTRIRS